MAHNHHNNQPNPETHLFAMGRSDNDHQYFLFDPTDPQNTVPLNPPDSLRNLTQDTIKVLNRVNGYLCFYGYNAYANEYRVVMWNPIDGNTEPEVTITPNEGYARAVVGCGVCPVNGPKIVKISVNDTNAEGRIEWENNIDVYTVMTGEWRNVEQGEPFMSCVMECAKVCVDGRFIYMRAYDSSRLLLGDRLNFFISFNFVTEQFGEVPLPERLSRTRNFIQSVNVIGSLGLLEYRDGNCQVWTTEEDDGRFTWLSDQSFPAGVCRVMTLRKDGMPVMAQSVDVGGRQVSLSAVRLLIPQLNPHQSVFAMGELGNGNQYFLIDPYNYTVTLNPPDSLRNLSDIIVLNCVNGYLCFYGQDRGAITYRLVMWNPITGSTGPEVPITPNEGYTRAFVGCGVSRANGPKIVRISARETPGIRTEWRNNIDVYTVRTGEWRNVEQDRRFMSCDMEHAKVCVDGRFIYMRAYDSSRLPMDERRNFFISFDFEREVFGEVPLPERFSFTLNLIRSVKIKGSLGLLEFLDGYWHVWTMEENANGTFSWLSDQRRRLQGGAASIIAFRKNGKAVMVQSVNVGGGEVPLSAMRPLS